MILSCHSRETRELNDTPRSYSTSQTHCSAHLLLPPPLSSSAVRPGSGVTPPLPRGAQGLPATGKSPDTEVTGTRRSH